jgi:hypothetical protein
MAGRVLAALAGELELEQTARATRATPAVRAKAIAKLLTDRCAALQQGSVTTKSTPSGRPLGSWDFRI